VSFGIAVLSYARYEQSSLSFVDSVYYIGLLLVYSFVGLHRSALLRWITCFFVDYRHQLLLRFVVSFRRSSVISLASLRQLSQSLRVGTRLRRRAVVVSTTAFGFRHRLLAVTLDVLRILIRRRIVPTESFWLHRAQVFGDLDFAPQ